MKVLPRITYETESVFNHVISEMFNYSTTFAFSNLQDFLKKF